MYHNGFWFRAAVFKDPGLRCLRHVSHKARYPMVLLARTESVRCAAALPRSNGYVAKWASMRDCFSC